MRPTQAPNFAMVIKEGDVAWLPTGYVFIIHHLEATIGLRWGVFPSWPGEAIRCRKVTAAAMEAFASMKGTAYDDWNTMIATIAEKGDAA